MNAILERSFSWEFLNFFQGCLPIPSLVRAIFRGQFPSRAFSVFFSVSGLVGHPEAILCLSNFQRENQGNKNKLGLKNKAMRLTVTFKLNIKACKFKKED